MLNDVAATATDHKFWGGGRGSLIVEAGTWGGGSVQLQAKSPNGTWINVDTATATADAIIGFELARCELKVVVTTSTGVYAWAAGSFVQ
jgi:hypothetical protein